MARAGEARSKSTFAYELRDGKVVRAVLAYPDTATALEAVGLRA